MLCIGRSAMEDDMPLPHEQRPMNNRDLADQQTTQDPGQHSPNGKLLSADGALRHAANSSDTPLDPIRDQINGVAQELKRALEQAPQSAQEPSLALGHLQSIIETQVSRGGAASTERCCMAVPD